jgi:DNA primase
MVQTDLSAIKQIPILEIAKCLGIEVRGKKAMCFNGHDSRTPSLCFYPPKNTWRCFGACGRGGDAINLVMEVCRTDFRTALDWFEREFQIDVTSKLHTHFKRGAYRQSLRRSKLRPSNSIAKVQEFSPDPEIYSWLVTETHEVRNAVGLAYLEDHGITAKDALRYQVRELSNPSATFSALLKQFGKDRVFRSGVASGHDGIPHQLIWTSHTLLFPFFSGLSVIYLQGRILGSGSKFIGLRGIEKPLFHRDVTLSLEAGSRIHICEGVPDALALLSNRLVAVAVLGASSFRREFVDILMPFNIVVVPDADAAGRTFAQRVTEHFRARGKSVALVRLPPGKKDVADVIASLRRIA